MAPAWHWHPFGPCTTGEPAGCREQRCGGLPSTLALYFAGNLIITFGTVTGLLEPSAAWESAGGVTLRAVAYVLFFLTGAAMSAALTVSYHRRHQLHWTTVAAGVIAPPVLLGGLLVVVPALLTTFGPR